MAVLALVERVGFEVTGVFLAIVHVSALNVCTEERGACRKVVHVAEAEGTRGNCRIHTDLGLTTLVAQQTQVAIIGNKIAIGILAAKGNSRAAGEG